MPLLLVIVLCSAVFGNPFFKYGFGQLNVLSAIIMVTVGYYAASLFAAKKRAGKLYEKRLKCDRWLWGFFAYGIVVVGLSYLGFYSHAGFPVSVLFDASYIPRQAYYLFFMPLIILLASRSSTERCLIFVQKNRRRLFVFVYVAYALWHQTFALNIPCCFCLGALTLLGRQRESVLDLAMLLVILVSPIAVGGEMTQAIIRAICLISYLAGFKEKLLRAGVIAMACVALACYIVPYLPLEQVGLDPNTIWRAQYWGNELDQLRITYGLGVGYGTSYATQDFVGMATGGPFGATAEYTTLEKIYVVGCHNSFVSLAFRLGIPGAAMIIAYVLSLGETERKYRGGYALSAAFCVISALVIVCFNVGFENPTYFFLFAFSVAFLNASLDSECGDAVQASERGWRK